MKAEQRITPKATTFRIDPDVQENLAVLAKLLRRPLNQLVNEAVRLYVQQRNQDLEADLEASLAKLRAYKRADPDFEKAIAGFVTAEAQFAAEDPVEGRPLESRGPVQTKIDELLHG